VLVRLNSGLVVRIRRIRPDDKQLLSDGLARLSWDSAYRRFLAPKTELTPAELVAFTEVDFRDHVAMVAIRPDDPRSLAGVGRWVRSLRDPEAAEFAFVVADDLHREGLGTALVSVLADEARARGVRRVTATILPHNIAAHRLLAQMSDRLETTVQDGVFELRGDLAA
jgi:RimJ/RimL family protein N-acetyltransferase